MRIKLSCCSNSLLDNYDHIITTLLYGNDKIKFDDVSNVLTNYEYCKKDKQAQRDMITEALIVNGMSNEKKLEKDECAYCHKKGHWKKDCPLLQNKDKNDSNANVAHDCDEDFDFALTSSLFVCHSNEWALDLACTFHMCPKKEWFYNREELELGLVIIGNDQTCDILGKGKINLKLHDGTVHFLNEVRYVLDLKRNLISVGLLESKGFKVAMENGTLKVLHGALVVMMVTHQRWASLSVTVAASMAHITEKCVDSGSETEKWQRSLMIAEGKMSLSRVVVSL